MVGASGSGLGATLLPLGNSHDTHTPSSGISAKLLGKKHVAVDDSILKNTLNRDL